MGERRDECLGEALKQRHCLLRIYPRTGKRGRPRRDKLVACPRLRYGQLVKERDEKHRVIGVFKRCQYGDIPLHKISTVYIERHNLTLRHENRRLTRKTLAFSKKVKGLWNQLSLYQGYYNFVRPHQGLRRRVPVRNQTLQKWERRTPGLAAKLTDHVWSLKELMSKRIFINY